MEMISVQAEWIENLWLVWSVEEIARENLSVRKIWGGRDPQASFENMLFFANAGSDGILFAFDALAGEPQVQTIVSWHPIENRINRIGFSLESFLENWLTGLVDLR